jgi:hypothetical protein
VKQRTLSLLTAISPGFRHLLHFRPPVGSSVNEIAVGQDHSISRSKVDTHSGIRSIAYKLHEDIGNAEKGCGNLCQPNSRATSFIILKDNILGVANNTSKRSVSRVIGHLFLNLDKTIEGVS